VTPDRLELMLLRDEGERLEAYADSRGILTIGVGRRIDGGGGISEEESRFLLRNDIAKATAVCSSSFTWFLLLDPARQAVLISMAFQLGERGLKGFQRFLGAAEKGEWDVAAEEMLRSSWAQQTPARVARLAAQLKTGEWV
jgi:lysozyme